MSFGKGKSKAVHGSSEGCTRQAWVGRREPTGDQKGLEYVSPCLNGFVPHNRAGRGGEFEGGDAKLGRESELEDFVPDEFVAGGGMQDFDAP